MAYSGTNSGYYYSVALHASCALGFIVFALIADIFAVKQEEPIVFEMVEPSPEPPAEQPQEQIQEKQEEVFDPKLKDLKPIELPEPKPEEPTPPEEEPEPAPSPKPVEKKIEKPKPQKKMSYKDFIKKNPKKAKPQTRPTQSPKKIKFDKVSATTTHLNQAQASITRKGGTSPQMQNALSAYAQYIHSEAQRNWVIPSSIVGMELIVKIQFHINKYGKISNVKILQGSGNSEFDQSVVRLFQVLNLIAPPDDSAHTMNINFKSTF